MIVCILSCMKKTVVVISLSRHCGIIECFIVSVYKNDLG